MTKVTRIAKLAGGFRIGRIGSAPAVILYDNIGQKYGEFVTAEAARDRAIHLMRAEADATNSLRSWTGKQGF